MSYDEEYDDYQEGEGAEEEIMDAMDDDDEYQDDFAQEQMQRHAGIGAAAEAEETEQKIKTAAAATTAQAQAAGRAGGNEPAGRITLGRIEKSWSKIRTNPKIAAKNKKMYGGLAKSVVGLALFIPRPLRIFEMDPLGVLVSLGADPSMAVLHDVLEKPLNIEPLKSVLNAELKKAEAKSGRKT